MLICLYWYLVSVLSSCLQLNTYCTVHACDWISHKRRSVLEAWSIIIFWWVCICTMVHHYTYNHYRIKVSLSISIFYIKISAVLLLYKQNCIGNLIRKQKVFHKQAIFWMTVKKYSACRNYSRPSVYFSFCCIAPSNLSLLEWHFCVCFEGTLCGN